MKMCKPSNGSSAAAVQPESRPSSIRMMKVEAATTRTTKADSSAESTEECVTCHESPMNIDENPHHKAFALPQLMLSGNTASASSTLRSHQTHGDVVQPISSADSAFKSETFRNDDGFHALDTNRQRTDARCSQDSKNDDLDSGFDHDEIDLENLVAQDWKGQPPSAPLLRRQKRRQRQRANAKVGRALRRFTLRFGSRNVAYNQFLLEQAQRSIVGYLDYIFGPMNLPDDTYLKETILDPIYKSATVASIIHLDGVQRALFTLGPLDAELSLAIVIDSLRWSQILRCGPICYPDGEIVYLMRVKQPQTVPLQSLAPASDQTDGRGIPNVIDSLTVTMPVWFCMCGLCQQIVDARFGYCSFCGVMLLT